MAGHRDFESSAERRPVDRHHHGFHRIFNFKERGRKREPRPRTGGDFSKLFNVGSGDEGSPPADHDNRRHLRRGIRLLDPFQNPFGNAGAQCIHRWILDGNDSNVAVSRVLDELAHFVKRSLSKPNSFTIV